MKHDWILDVLTDLRKFAGTNGFSALAEQLDDTKLVASLELAQRSRDDKLGASVADIGRKQHPGAAGTRFRA